MEYEEGDGQESRTEASSVDDAADSSKISRVYGVDQNVVSEKQDSELGFAVEDGDGLDGNGGNGGLEESGSDQDLRRRAEEVTRQYGSLDMLAEVALSCFKDPLPVYEDFRYGLQNPEFFQLTERERKAERSKKSARLFARKVHEEAKYPSREQEEIKDAWHKFSGPFASAFQKIKDEIDRMESEGQSFLNWVPPKEQNHGIVPSLAYLSMSVLARNSELISSLDCVPYELREELSSLVCDLRKMDCNFMRLLVAGSPEEISVKDCSWMTVEQFNEIFHNCNIMNLRVLRLDLCGRIMFDFTLPEAFGWALAQSLCTLSLKGAAGLTDEGLESLTQLAPSLKSINLSMCSLITAHGIHTLANTYSSFFKELYLDECPMIDAVLMLPALMKLKKLEVLSVAGLPMVTDEFVAQIAGVCGSNLKELRLADCLDLTDKSIEALGAKCSNLTFLDLSNLDKLSDLSLQYITNGCHSIQCLKLHRNRFSDEALGAFLEVAGQALTELSLNYIRKVGAGTTMSIAKYTRDLVSLDISWCRGLSNEMVGLIVDSCKSLKLLKLFGCNQISEVFLNGLSNQTTKIIGLKKMAMVDRNTFIKPIKYPAYSVDYRSSSKLRSIL